MPPNIYDYWADGNNGLPNAIKLNTLGLNASKILKYPTDLGTQVEGENSQSKIPFMVFAPYKDTNLNQVSGQDTLPTLPTPIGAIVLPISSDGLATSYSVNYTTPALNEGWAGVILTGLNQSVKQSINSLQNGGTISLTQLGNDIIAGAKSTTGALLPEALKAGVTGVLGEKNAGVLGRAAAKIGGVATNPFEEVMFEKANFRTHKFTYLFTPRNRQESVAIDNIIQTFRFYMMPAFGTFTAVGSNIRIPTLLKLPYAWQITRSVQDTTFGILPSVLESCDVDYSGGQGSVAPSFFYDKQNNKRYPAQISLVLTFKETYIITRDRLIEPQVGSGETVVPGYKRFRF